MHATLSGFRCHRTVLSLTKPCGSPNRIGLAPFAQEVTDQFLLDNGVEFVDQRDYLDPSQNLNADWFDYGSLEDQKPFAHLKFATSLDMFARSVCGAGLDKRSHVDLLAQGSLSSLLKLREEQVLTQQTGKDDKITCVLGAYLHLDGASVKGLSLANGSSVTVLKLRLSKMICGVQQFCFPSLIGAG